MEALRISRTNDYLIKEGKSFFYLADTIWSAFTHITFEEWQEYLGYRKMQGFNALQISILPITHDASESDLNIETFHKGVNGNTDFFSINHEYFERAGKMLDMAVDMGFIPVLVVLWASYVPETWFTQDASPEKIMPFEAIRPYVEYVVNAFSQYDPIYLVSGDTDLISQYAIDYYLTTLKTIKHLSPHSLASMHVKGGEGNLPEVFTRSGLLDFYMYQSSHFLETLNWAYELAQQFYNSDVKLPVINGRIGRYDDFDVRKAIWGSLLSGAKAGITYGAHGIWSWHKKGKKYNNEEWWGNPFDWRIALRQPGAWDAAFAKWIFETYELFDIEPINLILNKTPDIRMSIGKNKILFFLPYNTEVKVGMDLSGYDWTLINLKDKRVAKPEIIPGKDISLIKMHEFNCDVLIVGRRGISG